MCIRDSYQVAFTYFGQNLGDYRLKQTTNNGRVFEYVGNNLGDYKAVRKLPAPQKSQVFSANTEILLNEGKIGADFSLSNFDVNLFSSKDANQNIGYAGRIFGNKTFTKNNWKGTPSFEFQHKMCIRDSLSIHHDGKSGSKNFGIIREAQQFQCYSNQPF